MDQNFFFLRKVIFLNMDEVSQKFHIFFREMRPLSMTLLMFHPVLSTDVETPLNHPYYPKAFSPAARELIRLSLGSWRRKLTLPSTSMGQMVASINQLCEFCDFTFPGEEATA